MTQYDINFREYWRILKKRRTLVIFVTIIFSIFFTIFAYLKAPTPIYTTDCLIEFERSPAIEDFYGKFDPSATDEVETQMTMVKSYTVFEKVVEKLALIPQKDAKGNGHLRDQVIATIENLRAKVEVEREGGSAILIIRVTDTDAAFARTLTNAIALSYKETHAEQQTRRNTEQLKYIVSQLENVRKKLRDAEDEVNRFTKENELISIDLQSEKLLVKSDDLQEKILQLEADKAALDDLLSRLENFVENPFGPDHNFYSTAANSQYQGTNDAMVGLILKRDSLLREFTPKHPNVLAISDRILENAKKMSFLLQTQMMAFQKKKTDLEKNLKKVDRQIKVLMEKRLEFDRLKRKVDRYDEMMALLERKNQEALIKKAEKPEIVNIVKPALLPTHPINSRNTVSAGMLSVFIGVVLGFVVAFIAETFDTSLGAIEDVEETLGTKVLGVIPQGDMQDIQEELLKRDPEKFKNYSTKHAFGVISHFFPKSMVAESFRALRTNIQYKDPDKKAKTLAVTSSSPEEGKSMVASNLAITMAQGGMKTLLIGSDLRKPGIDKAFGVDRTPGLSDILIGDYPWRDTVKTVTDIMLGNMSRTEILFTPGLDHLHIITSGPPPQNPAELIDSKRLEEFIEEVKKEYDVIIFDSSPILSTADAAILGTKVDGVLLVYRVGSISKGLLKRTASQLEQVQCNLMGVIVNGINPDISPDFQGYKYYKYYYSYGESKNNKSIGEAKRHIKSAFLMYIAIACLSVGFLWQSGLIASFKRSIRGTPQPGPVSSEIKFRKKIVKMDMPTSTPTLISPTELKPEKRTPRVNVPPTQPPAEQALAEHTRAELVPQEEQPSEKVVALVSALLYGTANKANFIKPAVYEENPEYSYTLQLGAYRNIEGAKAAVTTYRGKGMSAYWSEIALKGNKRWFRVFTGVFKNPGDARTYREEQNLLKSIVKKAPYGTPAGTFTEKTLPPISKTPEPVSKESGTNGSGNHEQDVVDSIPESISPQSITPDGKPSAEQASPEHVPAEMPQKEAKPKEKVSAEEARAEQAHAEQTPAASVQLEKPTPEVAAMFSGPFFGKASLSDLKKSAVHDANPTYPYSIQLGAFRTLVETQNAVSVFREKGISSYWSEVDLGENEKWFRVYTGFFETREEARKYGEEQNLGRSIVKETPHSTLIGTYGDRNELDSKILLLSDLGYMPYTIEDQDNRYRLFVGAFVTEQGAKEQRRNLVSKGIESQVIRR